MLPVNYTNGKAGMWYSIVIHKKGSSRKQYICQNSQLHQGHTMPLLYGYGIVPPERGNSLLERYPEQENIYVVTFPVYILSDFIFFDLYTGKKTRVIAVRIVLFLSLGMILKDNLAQVNKN